MKNYSENAIEKIRRDHKVAMEKIDDVGKRLRLAAATGDTNKVKGLLTELQQVQSEAIRNRGY